jgi:hypothetical protein
MVTSAMLRRLMSSFVFVGCSAALTGLWAADVFSSEFQPGWLVLFGITLIYHVLASLLDRVIRRSGRPPTLVARLAPLGTALAVSAGYLWMSYGWWFGLSDAQKTQEYVDVQAEELFGSGSLIVVGMYLIVALNALAAIAASGRTASLEVPYSSRSDWGLALDLAVVAVPALVWTAFDRVAFQPGPSTWAATAVAVAGVTILGISGGIGQRRLSGHSRSDPAEPQDPR